MIGIVTHGEVVEDQPAFLMRRVYNTAGTDITQASLSNINYTIHDTSDDSELVSSTALTISTVVFDTLQITAPWLNAGGEADGYNFGAELPGTGWATPGKVVQVQVTFDPASGNDFPAIFRLTVLPWYD